MRFVILEYLILKPVSIKTTEQTIPIEESHAWYYKTLLVREKYFDIKKKYQYIHIGWIQVALKPLTLEGLDACFMVALRDNTRFT